MIAQLIAFRYTYIIGLLSLAITFTALAYCAPTVPLRSKSITSPHSSDSALLDSLLHSSPDLARIADNPAYELQVIYTQIDRDAQNNPYFTSLTYHLNPGQYFNPASLVKLPVVALSLEKLNDLHQDGVSRRTIMATGTAFRCQTPVPFAAPADSDQTATVGNYIKRMLLVSDNLAYNRLYEFLGQRPLNERLAQLGYPNARITRRFAPCDTAANRHTNPISFHNSAGDTLYKQPALVNLIPYNSPLGPVFKGHAYQIGKRLIHQPYDFTTANYLPLADISTFLRNLLFPESAPTSQRLHLTTTDYHFLRRYLHATPHESGFRAYAAPRYFDAYKKYLYYGRSPLITAEQGLRIHNIVGMSHGFLSDVACFADSSHHSEFLLSAVLYVNSDGVINDGAYDYETIGLPFLAHFGQIVRQFEAVRPRRYRPNLDDFFVFETIR